MIFNDNDVCDLLMRGHDAESLKNMLVDQSVNLEKAALFLERMPDLISYACDPEITFEAFDREQQSNWHMPDEYKQLDIAAYVLGLCSNETELQRVGEELLLYQERDLFNLLRYLKYLVDIMQSNNLIWGVGRGSSVASFILYKLGVHKIDSIHYNLNIAEFLR